MSSHVIICDTLNPYKQPLLNMVGQKFFHMRYINLSCLFSEMQPWTDGNSGHLLLSFLKLQILKYCLGVFLL